MSMMFYPTAPEAYELDLALDSSREPAAIDLNAARRTRGGEAR